MQPSHGNSSTNDALGALLTAFACESGTLHAVASDGARQSPRGDSDPPVTTFGPLGRADRLNCEVWKKHHFHCKNIWEDLWDPTYKILLYKLSR
jgi:hypothetical protein